MDQWHVGLAFTHTVLHNPRYHWLSCRCYLLIHLHDLTYMYMALEQCATVYWLLRQCAVMWNWCLWMIFPCHVSFLMFINYIPLPKLDISKVIQSHISSHCSFLKLVSEQSLSQWLAVQCFAEISPWLHVEWVHCFGQIWQSYLAVSTTVY